MSGRSAAAQRHSPPQRPVFDRVDTSSPQQQQHAVKDEVESPSLTSGNALARFEFEPGRSSKDGTKVLMVEWEEDATTREVGGEWEITWEGKKTVLPAKEQETAEEEGEGEVPAAVNRLYFLLGPGIPIPTVVNLRKATAVSWHTSPLPAIFAPELGATATQEGKKGVLHTIWAKKRLQVLQHEIDSESRTNTEGIGLEMAAAEKEWIERNFGVASKLSMPTPPLPQSPRSPGGGRLLDKLKGLKLGTGAQDLTAHNTAGTDSSNPAPANNNNNPLSPETSDVAVGSFGCFTALKGPPPTSTLAAKPPQRTFVPQRQQHGMMGSLNALAGGGGNGGSEAGFSRPTEARKQEDDDDEDEANDNDLFALPMSPRSPEMTKSPFSFGKADTMRYVKG